MNRNLVTFYVVYPRCKDHQIEDIETQSDSQNSQIFC